MSRTAPAGIQRISASSVVSKLAIGLRPGWSTLILDARRAAAFDSHPWALRDAIPILLDQQPTMLPDVDRGTAILVYCQCTGQASSTRVARWLLGLSYQHVWVLEGGLSAWSDAGQRIAGVQMTARETVSHWIAAPVDMTPQPLLATASMPLQISAPTCRNLAVLFVDMVAFTDLLQRAQPESVLALVQTFMRCVSDVASHFCGDVRDFEGDGALLYFASPTEALPAAFDLRLQLAELRRQIPELPEARFAIDFGPIVLGPLDGERRTLAFIGAAVITAARLLKHAEPNEIIVTPAVMQHATAHLPELASHFSAASEPISLKGFTDPVAAYHTTFTQGVSV